MNRRNVRRFCVGLVIFAVCVRALYARSARPPEPELPQPQVWVVELLAQQTPRSRLRPPEPDEPEQPEQAQAEATEPEQTEPEQTQPEQAQPEQTQTPSFPRGGALLFTPQEAEAVTISGGCSYTVDKAALLMQPTELDFSEPGPKVLIVHTHSSEAYTQEVGWFYEESDLLRTENAAFSVIRVGEALAQRLEERGIEVVHDTALNDYPAYDGAYERMRLTIEQYLAQYPSIRMVVDVHRDAAVYPDGSQVAFTQTVNGEPCAQIMLVAGTDEGGLEHPGWQENLALMVKLHALIEREAPGLCRSIDLRTERFNQHETPGSMLVEFGSTGNTLAEALRSADYFAQALCALIESCGEAEIQ